MPRLSLKSTILIATLVILSGCVQPFAERGADQKYTVCRKTQPLQGCQIITRAQWKEKKCFIYGAPGGGIIKCKK